MAKDVFECENCGYKGDFFYASKLGGKWALCYSYGCPGCKKVITYRGDEWAKVSKDKRCLECKGELLDYPAEIRKGFDINKDRLVCPRCGKKTLKITRINPGVYN